MNKRKYQDNFFQSCERVRDVNQRKVISDKIKFLLETFFNNDLLKWNCLDVGCSSGVITDALRPLFKNLIGLDYDYFALSSGKTLKTDPMNVNGDGMALPFKDESFDFVLCSQVYEHVPDDITLFLEINRILKPGGYILFSGPNKLFPIEPHYNLPFLHWLPLSIANLYLSIINKGNLYYEKLRTPWSLRKILYMFTINDLFVDVVYFYLNKYINYRGSKNYLKIISIFKFLTPGFNWLLKKKI